MRINLAKDPSLRSGTTAAFTPLPGATLSITEDYAFYGKNALVVTKAAVNGAGVEITAPIPVVAGQQYAFSVHARLPITIPHAESAEIFMQIEWMNSMGVVVQTVSSASINMDSDDSWYRLGGVWTAPAGATFTSLSVIQPLPGTAGAIFILDALLIEQSNYIGGYFDNIPQAKKNEIVNKALSAVPQVINGLRLGADIVLNNHVFNTIDEDDTVWVITDIDGWWGQADPELPDIPRGTEDGSYDVEGRTKARQLSISGFFIPKDAEQSLTSALDRLTLATNLTRTGGWLQAHGEPTKAAWVRLSGKPAVDTVNARGRTNFQIPLRAGDPIKYHWDDSDPEGYTNLRFEAADLFGEAENIGTATVTGTFTITGPAGAGTRVYNATTEETMVLQRALRGAGLVANAYEVSSTGNVATIKTTQPNHLRVGDEVALLNMVIPFSESDQTRIVTAVSDVFPYSFSVGINVDDIDPMSTSGQVRLVNNDTLVIDTYNRAVTYNGETSGHRNKLTTLTDWIKFAPGENVIEFFDDVSEIEVINKALSGNVVTLETNDTHYLIPGEQVVVALPQTAPLSKKSLTGNVVTLTTSKPHGYSVGDSVDVQSTESAKVVTKSRTSNVSTLTTEAPHGVAASDTIVVALPATASPNQKQLTSNVATLTFQHPHGFSASDAVTVALPTVATVANKQLSNNQAILTTTAAHTFDVGDSITVAMPTAASVVGKARNGSQVVITTGTAHGFSVNDQVIVALPATATPTDSFVADGVSNLVTVTTTATHGFSVGDLVNVVHTVSDSTSTVTSRSATSSVVTLTVGTNSFNVGERITVSGVGARYNGSFFITARTSTTISYNLDGAAEAATASTGSVQNRSVIDTFNGEKIVETIPSTTTFTYRDWDQNVNVTRAIGTTTLTNLTNQSYNGTKSIISASGTTFAYNL